MSSYNAQTLSCSLHNIVSHLPPKKRSALFGVIEHLIKTLSCLRREASLLANYIVLQQCEKGFEFDIHLGDPNRWQQFYRTCLMKVMRQESGQRETRNHKNTVEDLAHWKHFDPTVVGQQTWLQELQLFEDNPLSFATCTDDVSHTRWLLQHENHLQEFVDEATQLKLKKLQELQARTQDEELRLKSTNYINRLKWSGSSMEYKSALRGFSSIVDILAKEMSKNAQNSLTLTFEGRQRKTIMIDFPKHVAEKMCVLINCPASAMGTYLSKWQRQVGEDTKEISAKKRKAEEARKQTLERLTSAEAQVFVQTHRKHLRGDSKQLEEQWINETYIMGHSSLILCYFHFLLERIETKRKDFTTETKQEQPLRKLPIGMFHLLPISHYKRCFIDIQPRLFDAIVKRVFQDEPVPKRGTRNDWSSLFRFENIRSNPGMMFEGNIKTDGVRACVLFGDGKRKVGHKPRKTVQFKRRKQVVERERKTKEKASKPSLVLQPGAGTKGLFDDDAVRLDPASLQKPLRIISVDPGRKDVVTIFDSQSISHDRANKNGQFRHMSRKEFYHLRKVKVYAKRREYHWRKYLEQHPEIKLNEQCFTTSSSSDFREACFKRSKIDDLVWQFYMLKMHSDWAFEMHKAKQRTQVVIAKRILGPKADLETPTLVAYGDGSFSTSSKGHAATPLRSIPQNLSRHALVIMTKEFNTSKVCPNCKEKTLEQHSLRTHKRTNETRIVKRNVGRCLSVLNEKNPHQLIQTTEKVKLPASRRITMRRWKYEQQKEKGDCFRILACATQCSKKWIFHRDQVACLNIAEVCLETVINGRRPDIFKRQDTVLVEGHGNGGPISTTF
jgi:hypothetical protein